MATHILDDPRVWRFDAIDDRQSWYYSLSPRCLATLDETIRRLRQQPRPTTELCADEESCTRCAEDLQPVRIALESGRGFAIIKGPTGERYSPQEMQVCYWLLGQLLGRPIEQNVQGVLLYDVRDSSQDVRYGARFSVTNAESGFHTDNSFGSDIVDYVGLLCLRTAKSGGLSQVVSGYSVHEELHARHAERQALDALDEAANDPALHVEFALEPGEMFFVNNRWILHNRTAFEDHAEPEQRRHLVRLWLRAE